MLFACRFSMLLVALLTFRCISNREHDQKKINDIVTEQPLLSSDTGVISGQCIVFGERSLYMDCRVATPDLPPLHCILKGITHKGALDLKDEIARDQARSGERVYEFSFFFHKTSNSSGKSAGHGLPRRLCGYLGRGEAKQGGSIIRQDVCFLIQQELYWDNEILEDEEHAARRYFTFMEGSSIWAIPVRSQNHSGYPLLKLRILDRLTLAESASLTVGRVMTLVSPPDQRERLLFKLSPTQESQESRFNGGDSLLINAQIIPFMAR